MSLLRDAKGVLMLTQGSAQPGCIVPANLKYDKGDSLAAAQLADRAAPTGQVLAASDPPQSAIAPLKTGVVLIFVAAPDRWPEARDDGRVHRSRETSDGRPGPGASPSKTAGNSEA
jgi:hypothetical protein